MCFEQYCNNGLYKTYTEPLSLKREANVKVLYTFTPKSLPF